MGIHSFIPWVTSVSLGLERRISLLSTGGHRNVPGRLGFRVRGPGFEQTMEKTTKKQAETGVI